MKRSGIILPALLIVLLAGTSVAGPPLNGSYDSVDLGGPVYVGRYTEGWDSGGGAIKSGTTLNAESWDESVLGTQWHYWCSTESSDAVLLVNTVNPSTGNGNRTYMKTFAGGYIRLSGSGPWANGDLEYFGTIDSYHEFETITYSNWVPIAAVTNVQAIASFDAYPSQCMTFYIGNGTRVATTELGNPIPDYYPDLLDPDCDATRTEGAFWNFTSVTLSIVDCATGTEETSWGAVKTFYTE
ncbi:MAG TPA: hypothetical protein VMX58_04865 [Patescibacteria group bacterium]|nr:hypothetical protein [Patescibacteria group bacterium]